MRDVIKNEIFVPILKRGSAFVASYLLILGIPPDAAHAITMGVVAVGGVLFDVVFTHFSKGKNSGSVQ